MYQATFDNQRSNQQNHGKLDVPGYFVSKFAVQLNILWIYLFALSVILIQIKATQTIVLKWCLDSNLIIKTWAKHVMKNIIYKKMNVSEDIYYTQSMKESITSQTLLIGASVIQYTKLFSETYL